MQTKRELLVSRGWIQAAALVALFGFLLLGILAYRTYTDEPPIPSRVMGADGQLLFTGADISAGQEVFLKNGLMEYGSIFGHGAYLGPDFTADYLHRAALISNQLNGFAYAETPQATTIADFKANRYDEVSGVLTFSAAQTEAFRKLLPHYADFFATPDTRNGLRPSAITDLEEIKQLTAFFAWSAWTASALRPKLNYSYTNNWPPEPLVGNRATADALVWSVLSLIALLGGTGLLLAAFGRWNFLGWHGREADFACHFGCQPVAGPAPHQLQCLIHFAVGKQSEKRRLPQLHGQALPQRVVEHRIAGLIVEVRQNDRVLVSQAAVSATKIEPPRHDKDKDKRHRACDGRSFEAARPSCGYHVGRGPRCRSRTA